MPSFYSPTKNTTDAYYTDGTDEWYGKAAAGTATSQAGWMIVKIDFTDSNWITKYPVDSTTGKGSDAPKFIWDNVASYTYNILGT